MKKRIFKSAVYDNNGNASKHGVDRLYRFTKAGHDLGACMEKRGYSIEKHQVIPDPDFTSEK